MCPAIEGETEQHICVGRVEGRQRSRREVVEQKDSEWTHQGNIYNAVYSENDLKTHRTYVLQLKT